MRLSAVLSLVMLLPCAVIAAPSDDLKLLLDQGRSQEAYELGKRIVRQTGDVAFERYFRTAAIDIGNVSEGVRLLEDYLKAKPDDLVSSTTTRAVADIS